MKYKVTEEESPVKIFHIKLHSEFGTSDSVESKPSCRFHDVDDSGVEQNLDGSNLDKKYLTIRISKKYKLSIRKALIPLRFALFFWYGAARITTSYLSVFAKQRGLSLIEFASVFPFTSILQFLSTFFSGMVADKIGNAKPVLLYHLLFTSCVVLSFILAPRITDCSQFSLENQTPNSTGNIGEMSESLKTTAVPRHLTKINLRGLNITKSYPENKTFSSLGTSNENCTPPLVGLSATDCTSRKTKIIYILLILLLRTSLPSVFRFMEVTIACMAEVHESYYGFEATFGVYGQVIIAVLSGVLIYLCTPTNGENNYDVVYWFSISMMCFAILSVICIKTPISQGGQNLWTKIFRLAKGIDFIAYTLILFVMGISFGFHDIYLFLFLEYLNAHPVIYSIQLALFLLYGLPFLWTSNWWLKVLGTRKLFVIALIGHAVRGGSYSLMSNSWYVILIETTTAVIYHLLWVSVVSYSHDTAPEGLFATVMAYSGAIHYGLGHSAGVFFGGMLINSFGHRTAFRVMASMCLMTAVLYSIFLYCRRTVATAISEDEETEKPRETTQARIPC